MRRRASRFRRTAALFVAAAALQAAPAAANSAAADYFRARTERTSVPTLLTQEDRAYYTALFSALRQQDWVTVEAMLAQRPEGPLHGVARAQFYLAESSPQVELEPILQLVEQGRELPWAEQLSRLALKRGAVGTPELPAARSLLGLPGAPKRLRPRAVDDGTMPAGTAAAITERIKNDDPLGARLLLDGIDPYLSPEARAEWRQRVAWSFYIENDDLSALTLARSVPQGSGAWVAEGYWTQALAAWRLGDCEEAAGAFQRSADSARNHELFAAGHYWASRAWLRCRQPAKVAAHLRTAAQLSETLYGMLAAETLGLEQPRPPAPPDFSSEDWQQLRGVPNVRLAVTLSEIGEDDLAGEVLKHQARIGDPRQYAALTRLARDLGLASTQLWMAYNAPRGGAPDEASRYPSPKWKPASGWRIDPALIYAHALQESNFRAGVTSPAGAKGLMQIMPAAARQHGPALGVSGTPEDLTQPTINLAFGQRHLEMLRSAPETQGLLPKVMAAYNAGIVPVQRWNYEIRDGGDPLLWMESIPYWETRGYVSVVLRNYWMYEKQAGAGSDSRTALAQGLWPRFPGLPGPVGVRMAARGH